MFKIAKSIVTAVEQAGSFKNKMFPIGAEFEVIKVNADLEVPARSNILCNVTQGTATSRVRVPVKEFVNMSVDGKNLPYTEEGSDTENVHIPAKFKITATDARKDRDGNVMYALGAYNKGSEFIASLEAASKSGKDSDRMDWAELLKGGFKADHEANYDPLQNYTISFDN